MASIKFHFPTLLGLVMAVCTLSFCMTSLPVASADASPVNRKLLDIELPTSGAFAQAQARAAAFTQVGFPEREREREPEKKDCKKYCKCHDCKGRNKPDYPECEAAAYAYASSQAFASGFGDDDEIFAEAFSVAKAEAGVQFGSEKWKNKYITYCTDTSYAYASATSYAYSSGGK